MRYHSYHTVKMMEVNHSFFIRHTTKTKKIYYIFLCVLCTVIMFKKKKIMLILISQVHEGISINIIAYGVEQILCLNRERETEKKRKHQHIPQSTYTKYIYSNI